MESREVFQRRSTSMTTQRKFVAGGLVIVAAIAYLIWSGVSQSVVYFVTPSELLAAPVANKTYRLGGLVLQASLILAKHSEEYKAPHDGADPGYKELLKSLRGEGK